MVHISRDVDTVGLGKRYIEQEQDQAKRAKGYQTLHINPVVPYLISPLPRFRGTVPRGDRRRSLRLPRHGQLLSPSLQTFLDTRIALPSDTGCTGPRCNTNKRPLSTMKTIGAEKKNTYDGEARNHQVERKRGQSHNPDLNRSARAWHAHRIT